MIRLQEWLDTQLKYTTLLFETQADGLTVQTHRRGATQDRLTLTRHPEFDLAMIEMVEGGLINPDWLGFMYVMFTGAGAALIPRYIGKAEKKGVKNDVSVNLLRLRTDSTKFGRWGYNSAYHIGELSHAVLGDAFKPGKPQGSYGRWRDALFSSTAPPVLREPVCIHLIPWRSGARGPSGMVGSVAAVEYELIALAAAAYPVELLNTQGR